MIGEAVQRYHDLLTDIAAETHDALCDDLARRGLFFGNTPLCRVLRPHFYDRDSWVFLKRETETILSAFAKAHSACMGDSQLRQQLDLEPYEEELFYLDKGVDAPWSSSRLDAFFMPEERILRFVEYNAETPAGIGYADQLTEAFLSLEVMRRFQQHYAVRSFTGLNNLLDVLIRAYQAWGGKEHPQIAIVDWATVPTRSEHEICREFFERNGYRALLADPAELDYRNGQVWIGDFRVDMIYKRVLLTELIDRMGIDSPIVHAVRDRAVFMTNSFSAKLMAKKASLAFLSDEANWHLFNETERKAIETHIPWTRRVSDRKTRFRGQDVELLTFIADNRERLVLKPNDDYGGHGVVIGWEASAEDWSATIQKALTTPYVAQERVDLVNRDFPMMIDNSLDISPRYVDANPYVFYGQTVGGCLTRLSSAALLNVTAGSGSVVPMFVIAERG